MFQCLTGRDPLGRVQRDHRHDEVALRVGETREHFLGGFPPELREGGLEVGQFLDPGPGLGGRGPVELEDLKYLINLTVSKEERALLDQLGEDAADGPHIHAERVLLLAEQDFGRTVPEGLHLVRERLDGDRKRAREPEVADLDVALVRDQQVLGLQVAVDHALRVAVVHALQQLVQHLFDRFLRHRALVLPHVFLEVVLDKLEDEVELLLIGLEDDLFETGKLASRAGLT